MPNLLADHDIEGHVRRLIDYFEGSGWNEIWRDLGWSVIYFADLKLDPKTPDRDVWTKCQSEGLILLTGNRNQHGAGSLEATIRELNEPHHLPVITIANVDRYRTSDEYAKRVAESCLEYFLDIEDLRGTGRLYVP
jgi:hypothetical protein